MKLSTIFLIIIALQFSLILFSGNPDLAHQDTSIFGFIKNPTNWNNTSFITFLGVSAAMLAAGALVGSVFFKPDILVFAGMITTFISWAIPIGSLWQLIYDASINTFGATTGNAWVFASLFSTPLIILAIFTIIGWWRGNSEL